MVIYVVDDEATIRMMVAYILRSLGHTVEPCASADEFLRRFERAPGDLVITDFIMPQMDGLELCRRIRKMERGAEVPLIVLTGFELGGELRSALEAEVTVASILEKPFLAETIIDAVNAAKDSPARARSSQQTSDATTLRDAVRAVGQRLQPRLSCVLPVTMRWDGERAVGRTEDVSTNGLYVVASRAPPIMSEVEVTVGSFEGRAPIKLCAHVAHVQTRSDQAVGFGLAIRELSAPRYYAWYRLIAHLQREPRGGEDARVASRVPLLGSARLVVHEGVVDGAIADISTGGMRVIVGSKLPSSVTVRFRLPDEDTERSSAATVRWMQRQAPARMSYGLAFNEPEPAMRAAISGYVTALTATA